MVPPVKKLSVPELDEGIWSEGLKDLPKEARHAREWRPDNEFSSFTRHHDRVASLGVCNIHVVPKRKYLHPAKGFESARPPTSVQSIHILTLQHISGHKGRLRSVMLLCLSLQLYCKGGYGLETSGRTIGTVLTIEWRQSYRLYARKTSRNRSSVCPCSFLAQADIVVRYRSRSRDTSESFAEADWCLGTSKTQIDQLLVVLTK